MTPQTKYRRGKLIDQIITDSALDYRFDDGGQPRMTEDIKGAYEHSIDLWNSTADLIDRKCGKPRVRARIVRDGAMSCRFEPADRSQLWLVMETLDDLDAHAASKDPDLQPGIVRWMADFLFVTLIPPELFNRAAHTKGHIWDRRLRHTKRAKARKQKAFIAETSLALEDARQEAEFISLLREARRKADRFYRDDDVLKDRDISIARPNVRVVQLGDHIGFMLPPPPPDRAK